MRQNAGFKWMCLNLLTVTGFCGFLSGSVNAQEMPANFRMSALGGFKAYVNEDQGKTEIFPIQPEVLLGRKVKLGFRIAKTTVEFLESTGIPLVESVVLGMVRVGEGLQKADLRLKKSHLYLRYSNGPIVSCRLTY